MALISSSTYELEPNRHVVFANSQPAQSTGHHTAVQMADYTITTVKRPFSWCQFGTAVFSFCLCNCTCGILGMIYSVLAYIDHKTGDNLNIGRKRSCAWGWTITAIVFGVIGWIAAIALIVIYIKVIEDLINGNTGGSYIG